MGPAIAPGGRIALIVAEDAELRDLLAQLLDERGYRSLSIPRLDAARDRHEIERASVILVDGEHAPGQVQRLLEAIAGEPHAPPMVLVSGSADLEELAEMYGVGYLRKPFGVYALLRELGEASLRGRRPSQRRQRVAPPARPAVLLEPVVEEPPAAPRR